MGAVHILELVSFPTLRDARHVSKALLVCPFKFSILGVTQVIPYIHDNACDYVFVFVSTDKKLTYSGVTAKLQRSETYGLTTKLPGGRQKYKLWDACLLRLPRKLVLLHSRERPQAPSELLQGAWGYSPLIFLLWTNF